jgi:hypothetical protein
VIALLGPLGLLCGLTILPRLVEAEVEDGHLVVRQLLRRRHVVDLSVVDDVVVFVVPLPNRLSIAAFTPDNWGTSAHSAP